MKWKILLIGGGLVALAAFLLGFVPEYRRARNFEMQLASMRLQLNAESAKSQMDQLGLLAGYSWLETNLKNYGIASQYSTRFFNLVRAAADQTQDPARQSFLKSLLSSRDAVTGALARGDPAAGAEIQGLFQRTLEQIQTEWK